MSRNNHINTFIWLGVFTGFFLTFFLTSCATGTLATQAQVAVTSTPPRTITATTPSLQETDKTGTFTPSLVSPSQYKAATPDDFLEKRESITFKPNQYPAIVFFEENFENGFDSEIWESLLITPGREQINPDQVSVISEKGRSIITLRKNDLHLYYLYKKQKFDDVQITVKIENQGVKDNNIGLVCGKNGENFYEFNITSGGQWVLQHHDEKGYKIIKKGGSYAINLQKGENEISIACANKTIIPYINGERIDYVGTLDDLGKGEVGFNVSSSSGTPVVVAIDNFLIKEPYSLKLLNNDEKPSISPEFYTEEFDQGTGNWNYDLLIRTLDGESYISIDKGKLITDFPNEEYQLRSIYLPHSYTNVALTLKIANPREVIGDPKNSNDDSVYFIGALCRITENGWYDFLVSTNGDFWIRIEEPDTLPYYARGYLEDKILRRGTLRIKTGEINEVTAVCNDDQLSLFVNGTHAITFEDDTFMEGKTGFSIGSDQRFPYHVEIESVTISKP